MTEVCNCGGGHRTWLKDQLVCLWGALGHIYKGGEGRGGWPRGARQVWGILLGLPSPSRIPLVFPIPSRSGPLGRAYRGRTALPLAPLYTGAGGHRKGQQTIVLVVCGAPLHSYTPRSYRRSA